MNTKMNMKKGGVPEKKTNRKTSAAKTATPNKPSKNKPVIIGQFARKILKEITGMFRNNTITAKQITNKLTPEFTKAVNKHYPGMSASNWRSAVTKGSPQKECMDAKKQEIENNPDNPGHKLQEFEGNTLTALMALMDENDKSRYPVAAAPAIVNGKMRMEPFTPSHMRDCGECWLCGIQVKAFSGTKDGYTYATPCGDCEHVSAVMASLLAKMLSSQGGTFYKSYMPSCIDCNRTKSNFIGVQLTTTGGWMVDNDGVDYMLYQIFGKFGELYTNSHEYEYNPDRIRLTQHLLTYDVFAYNNFLKTRKASITNTIQEWCNAANGSFYSLIGGTKAGKHKFNKDLILHALDKTITNAKNMINASYKAKKQRLSKTKGGNIINEEENYISFLLNKIDTLQHQYVEEDKKDEAESEKYANNTMVVDKEYAKNKMDVDKDSISVTNPFGTDTDVWGGKKKTRKHKKTVKQKTRKHKKTSTYKKK